MNAHQKKRALLRGLRVVTKARPADIWRWRAALEGGARIMQLRCWKAGAKMACVVSRLSNARRKRNAFYNEMRSTTWRLVAQFEAE